MCRSASRTSASPSASLRFWGTMWLDAWQAAKCRANEENKAEAKPRTSGMPISLTQGEHVSLRQSFEKAFGRMEDEGFPASGMIERRLQEVEQGHPTAEPLSDVASSAEASADAENIVVEADGTFKMRRLTQKVPLPNDSEELRRRVRFLWHTFTIAKLQNPNRPWLATASSEVWLEHLDYVLRSRVWGLNLGGEGRRRSPPWQVVLSYELALRREALRLVTFEGKNLREAMFEARRCTEQFLAWDQVMVVALLFGMLLIGRVVDLGDTARTRIRATARTRAKAMARAAARASSTPTSRRPRPTASRFASPTTTSTNDVLTARLVGVNLSANAV